MKVKISCQGIRKIFIQKGRVQVHVLEDISLDVHDNEFVVILGPGQSGKTTLLRIIAGLESPTEGRVLVDGKEVGGPGQDRGLVFQSYMLFPWRTVMGNVEMGPKLRGVSKEERKRIASHYINLVGLDGFENAYPHLMPTTPKSCSWMSPSASSTPRPGITWRRRRFASGKRKNGLSCL